MQERQLEQKKLAKDETDKAPATNSISLNGLAAALNQNSSSAASHSVSNGISVQNGNGATANVTLNKSKKANPPPPPPQKIIKQVSLPVGLIDKPPHTPAPDYDSITSLNDLNGHNGQDNGRQFNQQQFNQHNGHVQQNGGSNGVSPQTKGTMGRVAATEMQRASGNAAEMESIESFKMTHPASPIPHPPPVYFSERRSGPPTMKKIQRPISVIVGEYGNGTRKEPTKFDFIEGRDDLRKGNGEDVGVRLKNELEQTLSRSNLRKRNEMNVSFKNK